MNDNEPTGGALITGKDPSHEQDSSDTSADSAKRPRRRGRRSRGEQQPWSLEQFQVEPAAGRTRFHDLDLPLPLMRAIADLGFEYCSPIQAEVLPHTLDGYDAVGKAQTGTGKTAAFLLAAMHELLVNPVEGERFLAEPRVVVLAPTRELVMQIGKDAIDLAKYTGLQVHTLVGGMDYGKQLERIRRKVVDIVAATPGRLIDFITRGDISLEHVEVLVLDEADRMLDMGFIPQVRRIVRATPQREQRQTMLFSATFNYDVNVMIDSWMVDPVRIEIEPETVAADSVDQRIYMMSSKEKFSVLKNIIAGEDVNSVIVFANRRDQTRRLYEKLRKAGVSCGMLSGEIAQQKRTRTLEQFKRGDIKVLVATDVAGRGIHIEDVSHVVNYNLPEDPEDYVHRIGRTGRAGAKGISISLACEDDAFMLPDIEALLGDKLVCEQPPASLLDR
ncbi:MAG: ATP-dependent RNA helicase RhlB [Gammaproteobacteria bacterium]|nr:ATP-dependent RNA helicase RhlB [Gammaproteobacteria bacterium]